MPRRALKRILPARGTLRDEWYLRPFNALLHDPALWSLHRRGVTRGLAIGIFVAFLPLPGQMLLAAALAIWLRVNLPVAVLCTWITNPVTIAPMFLAAYRTGVILLRLEPGPFSIDLSWDWLQEGLSQVWKPLWAGSLLHAAFFATLAYTALNLAWRIYLSYRFHNRRIRRRGRARAVDATDRG